MKFKVGDRVELRDHNYAGLSRTGVILRVHRDGCDIRSDNGMNPRGLYFRKEWIYPIKEIKERKQMGTTLRERVRRIVRSKDDQVLIDQGFTYESGALTKEGRKVVADLAFTNGLKEQVVKLARQLDDEEKAKKK